MEGDKTMSTRRMALEMRAESTIERRTSDRADAMPMAPPMEGLPITAHRSSPISLPSASPTSAIRAGESWRDYATILRDFESTQSDLESTRSALAISSASLDRISRDLLGPNSAPSGG